MEITLLQIYALKQNALSGSIQPVSQWVWCGESECAASASWSIRIQELWNSSVPGEWRGWAGEHQQELMRGGCEPPKSYVPLQLHTGKCCQWDVGGGDPWVHQRSSRAPFGLAAAWVALRALGSWFQSVLLSAAASGTNTSPQYLSAPSTVSLATGNSPRRCNGWCVEITFTDRLIKAKCKWYLLCIHAFSEMMFVWPEVFLTFLSPSVYSLFSLWKC